MTNSDSSHAHLLEDARLILTSEDAVLIGRRERAAALLARSGLEQLLDEFWGNTEPAMIDASMKAQLLCMAEFVNPQVAGSAAYLYSTLSEACHYHPYDLPPTSGELYSWIDSIHELAETLR